MTKTQTESNSDYHHKLLANAHSILAGVQRAIELGITAQDDSYAGLVKSLEEADHNTWGTTEWIEEGREEL